MLNKDASIADCWDGSTCIFQFRRNFNDWDTESINRLLEMTRNVSPIDSQNDFLRWSGSRDVSFSVSSSYQLLVKNMASHNNDWPWKMVWKTKSTNQSSLFRLVAAHEACLTKEN